MKKGFKMTEETKKKMSLAKLGKKRPDLVGKKFCLGLKQSKESNQKRSQFMTEHPNKPWLGKTFSEEHKRKQRDSILKGILEGRNFGVRRVWNVITLLAKKLEKKEVN